MHNALCKYLCTGFYLLPVLLRYRRDGVPYSSIPENKNLVNLVLFLIGQMKNAKTNQMMTELVKKLKSKYAKRLIQLRKCTCAIFNRTRRLAWLTSKDFFPYADGGIFPRRSRLYVVDSYAKIYARKIRSATLTERYLPRRRSGSSSTIKRRPCRRAHAHDRLAILSATHFIDRATNEMLIERMTAPLEWEGTA